MYHIYSTQDFEQKYTYPKNDLGAVWCPDHTSFRIWAPTANAVSVNLYQSGNGNDLIHKIPMAASEKGTWAVDVDGDLNGIYYTYSVSIQGQIAEACDPYAHAVGVNGTRAMVLDLHSTNPDGWELDRDPNAGIGMTDCVIYELHVRDLSSDSSSGIQAKGKFLGLTESGTHTREGYSTGLDHIRSLGITHLHLLPVYDYGSIDESDSETKAYNWGYDPQNFNVPEGSYSTNPYDGAVRVREMKQMIRALHENGISVVMDVVYNHVYHTAEFCFNQIVPFYFSRQNAQGKLSNGSGCGNDTATERSMVRKFIVDSVNFWADEYHIDGFRFDLVGLIDTKTIQELMETVHQKHPNVIFYGEGWDIPTTVTKADTPLTIQHNADSVPGFAFFNDTMRDTMRGSVFDIHAPGFVSGGVVSKDHLLNCFRGDMHWSSRPEQIVNYVSCHDNHTLYDRIAETLPKARYEDLARRSRLAAAFNLLSCGVPFFQAGEEMLRSKKRRNGTYVGNSYCSPDSINSIKWNRLKDEQVRITLKYYQGLIALRKAHSAFRMTDPKEIIKRITLVDGCVPAICLESPEEKILCLFHCSASEVTMRLPVGSWKTMVYGDCAGTETLSTVEGNILVPPLSAVVLIQ